MRNFKVTRAAPSLSDVVIDEDVSGAQALTHAQLFFISIKLTTVTLAIAAVLAFFLVPSIQGTAQIMAQLRGIQRTAMNYGGDDNAFPAWTWFSEFGASMMTLVLFPLAVSSILYPTVAVRALSKYKLRFGLYIGTAVAVRSCSLCSTGRRTLPHPSAARAAMPMVASSKVQSRPMRDSPST
jgi:hypothetical protein